MMAAVQFICAKIGMVSGMGLARVLRKYYPRPNKYIVSLVAILGTTVSPYLFFWQASQEVEEELKMGRKKLIQRRGATDKEIRIGEFDVDVGMFLATVVFYFVILALAATLYAAGETKVQTATDAAQALGPLSSRAASILFSVGLIGSGFLAVPVLTPPFLSLPMSHPL